MKNDQKNNFWGLIIADSNELHKINLNFIKKEKEFSFYEWNEKILVVAFSGIGLINAAAMTQKIIDLFNPNLILNYGAVGGSEKLKIFDLVIPKYIYCHDARTPWYPKGTIPNEDSYYENIFWNNNYNLSSGNSFISTKKDVAEINQFYSSDIFDMETFAIAAIAKKNNKKFLTIKCISDVIGNTNIDIETINQNINKASLKAFNYLIKNYDKLKEI
ncbi:MAG: hypothetical protein ACRCRZ_00160 [Metamycoplasmataceae bacterium]